MKLVGRVPVEPLDDERLTNIERRIVAGATDAATRTPVREPRTHLALGFAIIAVFVLGAGVVGYQLRGSSTPEVAEAPPMKVKTDADRSTLDIGDAVITSDPATVFVITRPATDGTPGVLVTMTRGKVELAVEKRGTRAPLVVRAGDTDVVVVGTRFSVDFGDGSGPVDVRVTEGVVKVVRHQKETRVAAGEAWTSRDGLVAIAELPAKPSRKAIGDSAGSGEIEIDMSKKPDVDLHDRVAKVPDATLPVTGGSNSTTRPLGKPEVTRPALDNPRAPNFDLKTEIRKQFVLPAFDVGTTDPASQAAKYREILLTPGKFGTEPSKALYSLALIQHLKLGRNADAEATLNAYFRRFNGREKEYLAARWLQVRIACLAKVDNKCRQAAYTYVHEADGDSPATRIAERLTMTE